jgi:hypothetical protein
MKFYDGGKRNIIPTGTKGKMMCDTYGLNPRLLPLSKNENLKRLKNIAE